MSLWRRIFRPESRKADLEAELQSHLRMAVAERRARGESPDTAHAAALRELGNVPLIEDVTREAWGWLWLERLVQDLGYAIRQMRRSPGFAATVIGTLALGIGAAAAMFTVVDHVLLRPLPYRNPGRLVLIQERGPKGADQYSVPWLDLRQWIEQSRSFSQIGYFDRMSPRSFLRIDDSAIPVNGVTASPNLFATLGVGPALGRDFVDEPAGTAANKNAGAIVLSNAIWKKAFGGDPAVLGRTVQINSQSYVVIGVMPPGFEMPFGSSLPQVWTAPVLGARDANRFYNSPHFDVIARLRPGVSIETAGAEMSTIQKRIAPAYTDPGIRQFHADAAVEFYADSLVAADIRKALLALLAASGVLWLIASVNATNLLLARGAARQREIAMRGALGASRSRILQQFVVEGLVLSGAGALLGTGLALGAVRLVRSVKPAHLDLSFSAHLNFTILAALCGLTLLTALMSSAWPAIVSLRAPIEPALKQGNAQTGTGRGNHRVRSVLVVCEVALSLALLVACGLLLRTIYTLRHVPLGYRTDHILVAHLTLPSYRYSGQNMVVDLYQPLLERVQHLAGVDSAGYMSEVPLGQSFNVELTLTMNGKSISAMLKPVSPSMQRIFGFKMLAGRFFNDQDTSNSQPVIVVNRAFARLYAPDKHDPASLLGGQLLNLRKNAPAVIVGIVDDERQTKIGEPSQPEVELCLPQLSPESGIYQSATIAMDLAVRTERSPELMIPDLRSILRGANPELANATFDTMDQVVEDSFGSQRLAAHLLQIFGGVALLLSIAGLYGLLAWVVAQRTREMGVRIALGASRGKLLWLVMRQAGTMLLTGVAAGAALAWLTARFVRSYLYGVNAHDGWTMAAAAGLLCASGLLAAYIPARRAAKVDPMVALRAE